MHIAQTYESTIVDAASGISAHVMVVPARSLPSPLPEDAKDLFEQLGLRLVARLRPAGLSMYVLSVLSPDPLHQPEDPDRPPIIKVPDNVTAEQLEFAEYLTCARVVPFEESPLSAESIGSIVTKASGTSIGAFMGFVVAGNTPLLFVFVPAGMILFGAAAGVASALEQGLRERVLKLIRGRKSKPA